MDQSIYEIISGAVVDGRLPDGFSLPAENEKGLAFADGAEDGIMIYHRAPGHGMSEAQTALIGTLVDQVSDGDYYDAEETLWQVAEEIGTLDACEGLCSRIVDSHDALDLGNVFNFAVTMAIRSPNRRVVKLALGMIAAFKPGEEVRAFVRTLGLSDEFTLFAAMAMVSWSDPNAEWFDLAKRVTGWGRVHLVRMLRPETPEIRRWLLREGVHNDVMPQYSALDCWIKADVPAALAGSLSREDFSGIRDIIEALLDEGPVQGISGVEDAEAHLRTFLKRAEGMALDDRDREVLSAVRDYLN